jgi:hypothetical protein
VPQRTRGTRLRSQAARKGFGISKPYGDSERFDFILIRFSNRSHHRARQSLIFFQEIPQKLIYEAWHLLAHPS